MKFSKRVFHNAQLSFIRRILPAFYSRAPSSLFSIVIYSTFYCFTYHLIALHYCFFAGILGTLCEKFLRNNVSAILYLFNMETFGRATASTQYFFQLSSYLGIPVISWNADNSGLERVSRSSNFSKIIYVQ